MRLARGFTLIELLVVITIIVVLLALLTPALDRAIYQAEIAVCGTKQHAIAASSILYAADNKRFYPSRPANYAWDALILKHPNTDKQYPTNDGKPSTPFDLRPQFQPYGSLDMFVDPASPRTKLDDSNNQKDGGLTGSRGDVHIYSNYLVYTGWSPFQPFGPNKRLAKLGDRWSVTDGYEEPRGSLHEMSVLAADRDDQIDYYFAFSPHPHPTGANDFTPVVYQAQPTKADDGTDFLLGGQFVVTISYYQVMFSDRNTARRQVKGDYNYAYTDGSVRRENAVRYDDERMLRVQITQWGQSTNPVTKAKTEDGYTTGRHNKLPKGGD